MSTFDNQYVGLAGTWSIDPTASVPAPESAMLLEHTSESVFDPDYRALVDENDFKDGGKYRSIVKLQMRYERQDATDRSFAMGTGWLIRPDLLVTAGHNVYDWSGGQGDGLGRAVHINCYIGYHGRDSLKSPIVQARTAKKIVTTAEWLNSNQNRHRDVAFIQINSPFVGNLRTFSYRSTPLSGDEMLGVVGYPADKSINDEDGREEKGAMMYEQFNVVSYLLEDAKNNPLRMLKYRISTFGGQSGAPVIRKNGKQVAIGTHVYGGGDKNQSSTIGKYGNDYDVLVTIFSQELPGAGMINNIKIVKPASTMVLESSKTTSDSNSPGFIAVTATDTKRNGANGTATTCSHCGHGLSRCGGQPVSQQEVQPLITSLRNNSRVASEQLEPEFWSVFKSVGQVVSTLGGAVLPFASPLLGPLGGPISAVAGVALNAVSKACAESAWDGPGLSSHKSKKDHVTHGSIERSILAEATLQAVLMMDSECPAAKKVVGDMQSTYTKMTPNVRHVAAQLTPGLLSAAYKMEVGGVTARNKAHRAMLPARPLAFQRQPLSHLTESASESSLSSATTSQSDFMKMMLQPTKPVEGEEAFWPTFGNVLETGFKASKPMLSKGLSLLGNLLAESSFAPESAFDGTINPDTAAAQLVAKRAIMAECALSAVEILDSAELATLVVVPTETTAESSFGGDMHEESFGDFIKGVAQKIGNAVKTTAPHVVNCLVPAVLDVVSRSAASSAVSMRSANGVINGTAYGVANGAKSNNTNQGSLAPAAIPLRRKTSVQSMLNEGAPKVAM